MKETLLSVVLSVFLIPANLCAQQQVIYVGAGSNVYISPGQLVSFDSLVLTPSAGFNIAGPNTLIRNTSPINFTSNAAVQRNYKFSNTLSPYSGDVSIYYQTSELNSITPSLLQVNVYGTGGWTNYTSVSGSNVVTASGLSNVSLNELALASSITPLPLQWLSVSGYPLNNYNHVNWSTAEEANCKNYIVQKSADGSTWNDASYAISAFNTSGNHIYSWTDSSVNSNISYYRVRETDYDNHFTYSSTIVVKSDGVISLSMYPNPVLSTLFISTNSSEKLIKNVNIFDTQGRLVAVTRMLSVMQYSADVSRLAKGMYSISISMSDGSSTTRTFIKQ